MNIFHSLPRLTNIFLFLLPWQIIFIYYEPVINGAKWQYGTLGFYATELIAWSLVSLFLLQYIRLIKSNIFIHEKKIGLDRMFISCCLLFVVYCFLSALWAPVPEVARQHTLRIMLAGLLFIIFSSQYISVARARFWFIAGGILPSILGIWQFLSQSTFGSSMLGLAAHKAAEAGASVVVFGDERWLRAYGTMAHPNIFGGYLIIVLWFGFLYVSKKLKVNLPAGKAGSKKNIEDCVVLAALVLASGALVFTYSRSAWMAFLVLLIGTGYWFIKQKISLAMHGLVIATALICALLFFPVTMNRVVGNSFHEARSVSERIAGVAGAKELFFSSPWFGVGVGNYTARLYEITPAAPGWTHQPVHMVPVLIAVELGVVGLFLLCACLVTFFFLFRSVVGKNTLICFTAVGMFIPLFLLDHYFYSSYIGLVLLALLFTSCIQSHGS